MLQLLISVTVTQLKMFRVAVLCYFIQKTLIKLHVLPTIHAVRRYGKWRYFCHHERSDRIFVTA